MDKKDLKKILKPLMKECVRELLMEEGMLKVLTEVVQPNQEVHHSLGRLESQQLENVKNTHSQNTSLQDPQDIKKRIEENRKRMLDEIGKSGYLNGVNPFEGTAPLSQAQAPERKTGEVNTRSRVPPVLKDVDPDDPGVNIKGIMNLAAGKWKVHLDGKG